MAAKKTKKSTKGLKKGKKLEANKPLSKNWGGQSGGPVPIPYPN